MLALPFTMTGSASTDILMPAAVGAGAITDASSAPVQGFSCPYNGVPMTHLFNSMCSNAGLENEFMAWLVYQDIRDETTFACAADTMADVRDLVRTAKAAGVRFSSIGKESCVMKLWHAC